MSSNNLNKNGPVLLLFPKYHLGEEVVSRFLEEGFRVALFTLSHSDAAKFRQRFRGKAETLDIFLIPEAGEQFWGNITPVEKDRIQQPDLVLNFVGNELMKIKVRGKGEEWNIDTRAPEQRLLSFVDSLLQQVALKSPSVWLNIVHGVGGQSGKEPVFCSTRYGVMGLTEILRMNPRLKGVEIVDICLTYLKHKKNRNRVLHCAHCVAEKFTEEDINLDTPEDIASFLVEKSKQLMKEARKQEK